jgi:hypothetical protein
MTRVSHWLGLSLVLFATAAGLVYRAMVVAGTDSLLAEYTPLIVGLIALAILSCWRMAWRVAVLGWRERVKRRQWNRGYGSW